MTVEETVDYKDAVRRTLKQRNISTANLGSTAWRSIEKRHAEAHGIKPHYRLPLAVMASHAADELGDARRPYLWGAARPDHPPHSELPALRELLLQEGQWRSLRHQAMDLADAEALQRAGATWKDAQRKQQEEQAEAARDEAALRSCPASLVNATASLEMTGDRLNAVNANLDACRIDLQVAGDGLETCKLDLAERASDVQVARSQLDTCAADRTTAVRVARVDLDKCHDKVSLCNANLAERRSDNDNCVTNLAQRWNELQTAEQQRTTCDSDLVLKEQELGSLEQELASLRKKIALLEKELAHAREPSRLAKMCGDKAVMGDMKCWC